MRASSPMRLAATLAALGWALAGGCAPAPAPQPLAVSRTAVLGGLAFRDGVRALATGNSREAADHLRAAIAYRPEEGGDAVEVEPGRSSAYLPHTYLGVALAALGDCAGALAAWSEAEGQGAVAETRELAGLRRARRACAGNGAGPLGAGPESTEPASRPVRVYYATDRSPTGSPDPLAAFAPRRGDGELRYGACDVSIPRDHRLGELETPSVWWLEFSYDPEEHVTLLQVSPRAPSEFFAELGRETAADAQLLVFVHGYNVAFADAARRTAQLKYDLGFAGAAVLFSWPSQGETAGYPADEATVDWSWRHLQRFLERLHAEDPARAVYLVAHSMGNRLVARALDAIAAGGRLPADAFKEVVMAAPDIDSGELLELAANIRRVGARVTLYASANDKALMASRRFHGGQPRAGEAGQHLLLPPGFDVLDASDVDTDLIDHAYFGDSATLLHDLFSLIRLGLPPPRTPTTREMRVAQGRYWKLVPAAE